MLSGQNMEPEIKFDLQFNFEDDKFQTSNSKLPPETRLDDEIEELTELMEKANKPNYCKKRQKDNNMIHLTARVYINKEGRELQHKVWKPGRQKKTTTEWKQYDRAIDQ